MVPHPGQRNCTIIGRLVFAGFLFLALVNPAPAEIIRAENFDSFWLWAGVEPQPALSKARQIYLLAGEVTARGGPHVISQRSSIPHLRGPDVWIVYRAQTIAWNESIFKDVLAHVERWQAAGNKVVGLQIDFDSGTKNLQNYAAFLQSLRARLPARYRLSVTGLLDWSANADREGLKALGGVVDEVVVQIYQGRRVIPAYETYVVKLGRLKIPFRVGLLQNREWNPPPDLASNPYFRGYVVFLLN